MALYIDSAFLSDILPVAQTIPLAGITTSPSIVLAAPDAVRSLIPELDTRVTTYGRGIYLYYNRLERAGIDASGSREIWAGLAEDEKSVMKFISALYTSMKIYSESA